MSFSRPEYVALSARLCSSNVDEDTTFKLCLQLQQKTVVLRLSSAITSLQPLQDIREQAHPYSVSFHKEQFENGSKERSPPHNLRQKPGQYICCQNHKLIADIENDIMDPVMQCTTLPSHSEFLVNSKHVSSSKEIHTYLLDVLIRDLILNRWQYAPASEY
ncbi:hypothetical protein Tco_0852338 [Tanacetum coccineum]